MSDDSDVDPIQGTCRQPNRSTHWGMDLRLHVQLDPHYAITALLRSKMLTMDRPDHHHRFRLIEHGRLLAPFVGFDGLLPVKPPRSLNQRPSLKPDLPEGSRWTISIDDVVNHGSAGLTIEEWEPYLRHLCPPFCHIDQDFNTGHPYEDDEELDEVGAVQKIFLMIYFFFLVHPVRDPVSSDPYDLLIPDLKDLLTQSIQFSAFAHCKVLRELRGLIKNQFHHGSISHNCSIHGFSAIVNYQPWKHGMESRMISSWDCPWTRSSMRKNLWMNGGPTYVSDLSSNLALAWASDQNTSVISKNLAKLRTALTDFKLTQPPPGVSSDQLCDTLDPVRKNLMSLETEVDKLFNDLQRFKDRLYSDPKETNVPTLDQLFATLKSLSSWAYEAVEKVKKRQYNVETRIKEADKTTDDLKAWVKKRVSQVEASPKTTVSPKPSPKEKKQAVESDSEETSDSSEEVKKANNSHSSRSKRSSLIPKHQAFAHLK
jgi:hypothetical protein